MALCAVSLGGNLGPVDQTLDRASEHLAAHAGISLAARSSTHLTAPVGERAGGTFQNAAALLDTMLEPLALLDALQEIEERLGRRRDRRWGPRTIDLDLIFYGEEVIEHPRLHVPHPACWYRRFVLDPLVEIAGDFVHPEKLLPVHRLRERLLVRPLPVGMAGGESGFRRRLISRLTARFPAIEINEWPECSENSLADPALLFWLGRGATAGSQEAGGDPSGVSFDALPDVSRIDVSSPGVEVAGFVRDVVASALG